MTDTRHCLAAATVKSMHLVACCHCSQVVSLPTEHLGRPVQCGHCGNPFQTEAPKPARVAGQPPAEARRQWFLLCQGRRVGPLSVRGLLKLARTGKIMPETWVARGDSPTWVPAARVKGLTFVRKPRPAPQCAPAPRAATVPAPEPVTAECPYCHGPCRIPKPTAPTAFRCPSCRQAFRAASTSVGVVCQRTAAPDRNTAHHASSPTSLK